MENGSVKLEEWLSKLDKVVDPAHVAASEDLQLRAMAYQEVERIPTVVGWPLRDWQTFPYHEVFVDREKMLLNELAPAMVGALARDDRAYTIRANYGVGIVPSLFGCKILVQENQMPWVEPLSDDELEQALSGGIPSFEGGLGGRVLETEQWYLQTLSRFNNLAQAVHVYVCDVQGPFDVAHLVMGNRIYMDVFDQPDLVHAVLNLVTDTIIGFVKLQRELVGEKDGFHYHTNHCIPGGLRVCEDSPTNLSADMYREFCRPYNERIMDALGGGWVHYCGKAHQMLPEVLALPNLTGINFGNPEKQNAEALFTAAAEVRVPVIQWSRELPRWVKTGVTVSRSAKDLDEARALTAG